MSDLLHEYWSNEHGGEFGPVHERADNMRPDLMPGSVFAFEVWVSSWQQAMQINNERLGYGDYKPAEGVPDHFYSVEEQAVQADYLLRRDVRFPPLFPVPAPSIDASRLKADRRDSGDVRAVAENDQEGAPCRCVQQTDRQACSPRSAGSRRL